VKWEIRVFPYAYLAARVTKGTCRDEIRIFNEILISLRRHSNPAIDLEWQYEYRFENLRKRFVYVFPQLQHDVHTALVSKSHEAGNAYRSELH
jgi:hypothetical protein